MASKSTRGAWALCLIAAACSGSAAAAAPIVLKTGSFAGWSLETWTVDKATASFALLTTTGNPAPSVECGTVTNHRDPGGPEIGMCLAVYTGGTVSAPLAGRKYTVRVQFLSGKPAYGDGQGLDLVVVQSGNTYVLPLGDTTVKHHWKTLTFTGTLDASDFVALTPTGYVTAAPDLTSGTALELGISAWNAGSNPVVNDYDNIAITIE